jgi:cytochrome bd-type quinol oxidase subunit 1
VSSHVTVDRLQVALTVTFHHLFPIAAMGLALFIASLKAVACLGRDTRRPRPLRRSVEEREAFDGAAHVRARISAVASEVGVVTGIPLEFRFGTSRARSSSYAGIGVFLAGRRRVGEHALTAAFWWPIGIALAAAYLAFACRTLFSRAPDRASDA